MLPPIKLDLQLSSEEDLKYFKTLFLRNVGNEQMLYYFYADDIQIRIQVSGHNGAQLVTIGLFHYHVDGKSTSIEQFCPLADSRLSSFEAIQNYWGFDPNQAYAHIVHMPDEPELGFEQIREILHIVYKVNNLKAFI